MIIEVKNVSKKYSDHLALDNVSVDIQRNSVFGLLGPNGAGKTTLIRIINAITAPDTGEVLLNGKRLTMADTARIGYLPEERGLYKKMKVGEQALYLCRLKGLSKQDAMVRLKYWFEKFGIESWWNKKVEELSKGMAQKVQFITTVLHEPELLIFDEPFSGFDPVNAELLKTEILELRKKGATVIFSTHNMDSVERLCENIALINHSKVVLSGSVAEIKKQYREQLYSLDVESDAEINFPAGVQLVDKHSEGTKSSYKLRLLTSSTNELLAYVVNQANIIRFEEILPTMNDIFLKAVQNP